MEYLGRIKVVPKLPEKLKGLKNLSRNLYFSWQPEVRDLFIDIDRKLWKDINHNPVKFLQEVQQKKLLEKSNDLDFLKRIETVISQFNFYLNEENTWFVNNYPDYKDKTIAYFTAEFGFHESLPIYAGGLGVLAGDQIKSASDLGLPLVGISLFYSKTYFTQEIDAFGHQIAKYKSLKPSELPLTSVNNPDGTPLLVTVPIANRNVFIRVWEVKVGRLSVYLLDTNIPKNQAADREITTRLYAGDQNMRISQEIVLGMGGVLVLDALGIEPSAWHMNEGHSVFLALQRIKKLVQNKNLSFDEALEAVAANTIFTTHTPVPAGNDAFPLHIKDKYFQKYWESVGIRRHQFMELGSQIQPEGYEIFNLTILSHNLSRHRNGVSKLHGEVSRKLWNTVWQDLPAHEVPIDYVTNGVHAATWVARKTRELFDSQFSENWMNKQDDPQFWSEIDNIPDEKIWQTKLDLKTKMLNHVLERLELQYQRNKIGTLQIRKVNQLFKPNVLTIGFARRFATYKRATLIFRNRDRLKRILNDPQRPIQMIFAGKAHPKDGGGQELIRQIHEISMLPEFRGKIVFVENYDMGFARDLVSGVDVWLNNPRRTQEASGTSGQKGGMNGVLNFSVLDGWWCEGYNGENGWAFGDKEDFNSLEELDSWDNDELYDILENEIIPIYYNRNENNIPVEWIQKVKNAIKTAMPTFNTNRMVKDYLKKMYFPAIKLGEKFQSDDFAVAKDYAAWRERIESHWSEVSVDPLKKETGKNGMLLLNYEESYKIKAVVNLGNLDRADVKVQLYLKTNHNFGNTESGFEIFDMEYDKKIEDGKYQYKAVIKPSDSGNYLYTLRVLPYHPNLANPVELGIASWYHSG